VEILLTEVPQKLRLSLFINCNYMLVEIFSQIDCRDVYNLICKLDVLTFIAGYLQLLKPHVVSQKNSTAVDLFEQLFRYKSFVH
jgi:hypothetical protein